MKEKLFDKNFTIIPEIVLAPFGGAIADRFSKKKIMVILDFSSGLILCLFAFLLQSSVTGHVVLVGILLCVLAVIQSIYDPSVRASIPVMVSDTDLAKANGIVSIITSVSGLSGPILAGFLYGYFGIEAIFIINIVSFFVSACMELFLHIEYQKKEIEGKIFFTFCHDIKDTASYLIHKKRSIFHVVLLASGLNLFLSPIYTVGVPYVEKIVFGVTDQMYGFTEGIVGAGMIAGALLVAPLSRIIPMKKLHYYLIVLTLLILGMGAATLPGIVQTGGISYLSYFIFTGTGFILAICLANININFMTYLQLETPDEMMGKTMSVVSALSLAMIPVGQIIFGSLYELLGTKLILLYMLVALCNIIVTIILKKVLSDMEVAY